MTNRDFTKTLGKVLRRPTFFPLPAFMARILLGEMADELLLSSARVVPEVLRQSGFKFEYGDLESCLRHEIQAGS
jgi:NAD dependent epimerase/dehydratase family enzyme